MAYRTLTRATAGRGRPIAPPRPFDLFVRARLGELRAMVERCAGKPLADARPAKPRTLSRRPLI